MSVLALPRGAHILDLCCGAGRHSRALGKAGYKVLGIDLSRDLLLAAKSKSRHRSPQYLRGDMRALPLRGACMDGVLNLFTSFGYFPRDSQNLKVLLEVARILKPKACFVLDYFNSSVVIANLVARSEKNMGGMRLQERRHFDRRSNRLIKITKIIGRNNSQTRRESVRAYNPRELAALFKKAGLKVVARYGDLKGTPFESRSSPRCVLIGSSMLTSARLTA